MRHHVAGHRLSRRTEHRQALLQNLVADLFEHERVTTTVVKAKMVRSAAEHIITKGKAGTLHDRRQAMAYLTNKAALEKLFADIAPRYKERAGGYTRVLHLGFRKGDAAPMALVELV